MELATRIKKFENLHIVFWLIKDTCWMMEVKWLGALMILPTVGVALYIAWQSRAIPDLYVNLAILCWISANSFWMCMEFFFKNQFKNYAAIPFALGFVFVAIYYLKSMRTNTKETTLP